MGGAGSTRHARAAVTEGLYHARRFTCFPNTAKLASERKEPAGTPNKNLFCVHHETAAAESKSTSTVSRSPSPPQEPPSLLPCAMWTPPGSRCVTHRCCVRRIGEGPRPGATFRRSRLHDLISEKGESALFSCALLQTRAHEQRRWARCTSFGPPRGLSPPPLSPRPPRRVPALFPPCTPYCR